MKVLFAVNNEKIVQSVVQTYQKTYKDVLSYKTVYYFNALIKELQKDKSFDRIIISEDLEPFSNNNYDAIDKFIFDKLDSVSDEAEDNSGNDIPIILICSDRRSKSDALLGKLFGIGVYSAIIGDDRSIDEVCNLIGKPRGKKEAKNYYNIEADDVKYETENENNVSETEIQNIIAHYKKLGKNEDKFIESFDNIAGQYNDNQLKIIVKFLPLHVKAVLEQRSEKYKEIVVFSGKRNLNNYQKQPEIKPGLQQGSTGIDVLDSVSSKSKLNRPVIIPGSKGPVAKVAEPAKLQKPEPVMPKPIDMSVESPRSDRELVTDSKYRENVVIASKEDSEEVSEPKESVNLFEDFDEPDNQAEKRGRGRPKKAQPTPATKAETENLKGRGRPKKISEAVEEISNIAKEEEPVDDLEVNLFDLDDEPEAQPIVKPRPSPVVPPAPASVVSASPVTPPPQRVTPPEPKVEPYSPPSYSPPSLSTNNVQPNSITRIEDETPFTLGDTVLNNILAKNKKIVSFIGTSKNGTSFLVNNLAILFSSMGIKTAVLDMTTNKNAYYIFTKNQENLRQVAFDCLENLRQGVDRGVVVNKYLSVFTALPTQKDTVYDHERMIDTLVSNYSLILVDCDFNTPLEYFSAAQEIYIVQSMDILTIQPLTAFLRELKTRKILKDNIKIVINKYLNCRGLTPKSIIGGLAYYNDPAMSFMTELFDRNNVMSFTMPFEVQNYIIYLEGLVDCNISINKYTRQFMKSLTELGESVYPLVNDSKDKKTKGVSFSNNVNSTLEQMKKNY